MVVLADIGVKCIIKPTYMRDDARVKGLFKQINGTYKNFILFCHFFHEKLTKFDFLVK